MPPLRTIPALLFGFEAPVSRLTYLVAGVALMLLKYALDAAIVHAASGIWLDPLSFVSPLLQTRTELAGNSNVALLALVATALPFLWVGVSMSARRALDGGTEPLLGLLFFVPVVHWVLMGLLCILPSKLRTQKEGVGTYRQTPGSPVEAVDSYVKSAFVGTAAGLAIGFAMTALCVFALRAYGVALFFGTPVVMGVVCGYLYNRDGARPVANTLGVAALTVVLAGFAMLLFALEGALCIAMAAPPAFVLCLFGALLGRAFAMQRFHPKPGATAALMLVLPVAAGVESHGEKAPIHAVTTAIIVAASPSKVWTNVIGFSDLPAPPEWFFKSGIAYPMRATIDGSGVGAVRRCEFSTGAFVEPITIWDEPRHLAFDVASQPPSLKEWSPWERVHAPHVTGYMKSQRGEFVLRDRGDGTTLLEGTTYYTLDIYPPIYWTLWSDALLHAIHGRVLNHIKRLSE